jgi:hypothetical protein
VCFWNRIVKKEFTMRHLIASISIAASALLAAGGTALATNTHDGVTMGTITIAPFSGQPGSNAPALVNGQSTSVQCSAVQAALGQSASPPGQVGATNNNSPYTNQSKNYAGATGHPSTNNGNTTAAAQYDNSCLQHALH